MAKFAKLGLGYEVTKVLEVDDADLLDSEGIYDEQLGVAFLLKVTNWPHWIQTFETNSDVRNKSGRQNSAGIGDTFDTGRNAFVTAKPFSRFILQNNGKWKAPRKKPSQEGKDYIWNDRYGQWVDANSV